MAGDELRSIYGPDKRIIQRLDMKLTKTIERVAKLEARMDLLGDIEVDEPHIIDKLIKRGNKNAKGKKKSA